MIPLRDLSETKHIYNKKNKNNCNCLPGLPNCSTEVKNKLKQFDSWRMRDHRFIQR